MMVKQSHERNYGSAPNSAWIKLYRTNRWAKISKLVLQRDKICQQCLREDRVTPATLTHHINEWRENSTEIDFWRGPFEALCHACHEVLHGRGRPREYVRDIDEFGWPVDPLHPVYQSTIAKREREEQRKCSKK
jgi:5-methylcytosine-specific restriction protein A